MSENDTTITKKEFYFETPLYVPVEIERLEDEIYEGTVDGFSPTNKFETTYDVRVGGSDEKAYSRDTGFEDYIRVYLKCRRTSEYEIVFLIHESETHFTKVGQNPSLADLHFSNIDQKYSKELSADDLRNFKKAIGLAANGVGAGSFVYLRKIFENLIEESFNNNLKSLTITKSEFNVMKMENKIKLLTNYLPSQLTKLKQIYPILSIGVHELTEEDCLLYFPALKLSIELILDQKIENNQKEVKDLLVKHKLHDINLKIKRTKGNSNNPKS